MLQGGESSHLGQAVKAETVRLRVEADVGGLSTMAPTGMITVEVVCPSVNGRDKVDPLSPKPS